MDVCTPIEATSQQHEFEAGGLALQSWQLKLLNWCCGCAKVRLEQEEESMERKHCHLGHLPHRSCSGGPGGPYKTLEQEDLHIRRALLPDRLQWHRSKRCVARKQAQYDL